MKDEKRKKKIIKIAIIICIILIIILLFLLIILRANTKEKEQEIENLQEKRDEVITDYVRTRGEKERMQVYLAEYLKHLEREEYHLGYAKLYPDFKNNYFKTEESFIIYVKRNYSDLMAIEYENFERQGNYYILSVKITNLQDIESEISQKFIIYEKGLNDYYISFQVQY